MFPTNKVIYYCLQNTFISPVLHLDGIYTILMSLQSKHLILYRILFLLKLIGSQREYLRKYVFDIVNKTIKCTVWIFL